MAVPTLWATGEAVLRAVGPLRVHDVIALARRHSGGDVNLDPDQCRDALATVAVLGAAESVDGDRWRFGPGWITPVTAQMERQWVREYRRRTVRGG